MGNLAFILFQFHSGWRYLVIIVLIAAIAKLLIGMFTNGKWGKLDQWLGAATPIMIDIQLLGGLVLFFTGFRARPEPMIWEHMTIMLIALIVAHIGWARVKRTDVDASKFRTGAITFIVAGLLVGLGVARITNFI